MGEVVDEAGVAETLKGDTDVWCDFQMARIELYNAMYYVLLGLSSKTEINFRKDAWRQTVGAQQNWLWCLGVTI